MSSMTDMPLQIYNLQLLLTVALNAGEDTCLLKCLPTACALSAYGKSMSAPCICNAMSRLLLGVLDLHCDNHWSKRLLSLSRREGVLAHLQTP